MTHIRLNTVRFYPFWNYHRTDFFTFYEH